jgi:transaldolase
MNSLQNIKHLGQSIWLDNLTRELLQENGLRQLIERDGVCGVTSNPSIFHKAVSGSPAYAADLASLRASNLPVEQRYERLVIPDIQAACELLRPVYEASGGDDGYVSLEVSPQLADDESATLQEARRLHASVNRVNLLIKVPATPAGRRAFERLIGDGINVNVTLMFSLQHVIEVAQAYTRGLQRWLERGGDPRHPKAVASLFLSRVDTLVDQRLDALKHPEALALRGKTAIALAKLAYQRYRDLFHYSSSFAALSQQGVRPQYLLWASTGTKNPAYSDVLYLESLIGPETINTVPDKTLDAFRDHGQARATLEEGVDEAKAHVLALEKLGIDLHAVGETLQHQGVEQFYTAYTKLLDLMK